MVTFGATTAFGLGVALEHTFHELFAARLREALGKSVVNWNLAVPWASNDTLARLVPLAVPVLRPHVVLILFPLLGGREFMTATGSLMQYVPGAEGWDAVSRHVYAQFSALANSHDDQFNFYRNYKPMESTLRTVEWLFALTAPEELKLARAHIDFGRFVDQWSGVIHDRGRDRKHPGPRSHGAMCDAYWNKFVSMGALQRLAGRPT
jgi:hypothetical protein